VICIDATGEKPQLAWEHAYDADYSKIRGGYTAGPRATPTVNGDRVYAVGAVGKFVCLDAATGKPHWEHDFTSQFEAAVPQWGFAGSPLIEGDLVIVQPGGKKGAVAAFDKTTGERRWAIGENPAGYSSPVAATTAGKRMIYAFTGDALLAIGTNGTIYDSYSWKTEHGGNIATPLVIDDYIFISSAYQQGCALLRAEERGSGVRFVQVYARRGRAYQNHHCTSVFKDRKLYGFDGMASSARLKCVDFESGKINEDWEADGVATGSGTLILAGNHLVIQGERGDLYLVEATPEEFRLVAKVPKVLSGNSNWATPTLVDGRLYLRDETKVVCYDVR
jgi:outer membrane protein assembly factor BamB